MSWLDTEHPVTMDALKPGDVIHDKHGKVEGDHWLHVVVKVWPTRVDTITNNNNLGQVYATEIEHYYRKHPRGMRDECRAARRGEYDCRFDWGFKGEVRNSPVQSGVSMAQLLKDHYSPTDEGWHRLYKHYGAAVLARGNYRWKRKIMARFGPNRAMASRISWRRQMEGPSIFDSPILKGLKAWKGGTIEVPFR